MIFIGDVHGKFNAYKRILRVTKDTIQVGDMGVGFFHSTRFDRDTGEPKPHANPPYDRMVEGGHRFIRGNHDNPGVCKKHSQWIADGTVENGMMFIGGAVSIDREWRTEGYSWWPDEELSQEELDRLYDVYVVAKPEIMVTHDCPELIALRCFLDRMLRADKGKWPSRSRVAFQRMWEAHQPALWVFGHWHNSLDVSANGTRFVCLAELEARYLEP